MGTGWVVYQGMGILRLDILLRTTKSILLECVRGGEEGEEFTIMRVYNSIIWLHLHTWNRCEMEFEPLRGVKYRGIICACTHICGDLIY